MGAHHMKYQLLSTLLCLASWLPAGANDGLPVLQRVTLDNKAMWEWETELIGHRERNGAVLECLSESLTDLLQQAEMEPTVESLVQVLTSPSEAGTPQSSIKELLLPRCAQIHVSQDAAFAVLVTQHRSGGRTLEIFRNTGIGLTVQRLKH